MRFDPPPRLGSPKFSHPSPFPLCPDRCAQWPKFHLIPPRQGPATAAHKVPPAPAPARVALKQPVAGKLGVILERSANSPRNSRGRKGGALATVRPLFSRFVEHDDDRRWTPLSPHVQVVQTNPQLATRWAW